MNESEWQPIEAMPTYQSCLILSGNNIWVRDICLQVGPDGMKKYFNATHWMPLPKRPDETPS